MPPPWYCQVKSTSYAPSSVGMSNAYPVDQTPPLKVNGRVSLKPGPFTVASKVFTWAGSTVPEPRLRTAWMLAAHDAAPPESDSSEKNGEPEHAVAGHTSNACLAAR